MILGTLLRRHRKEKGLTLKAVADKAGVSEGFLSQIENNVKSPSLETLLRVCEAIGVDAGRLLTQHKDHQQLFLIRKSEWGEVDLPHTGFATRRFCPPEERTVIDSALLFIEPGRSIPVRKNIKTSQEILCILQGRAELVHGQERVVLTEGDAIHFWSEPRRQLIINPDEALAVVLWVGTL